MTEIDLRLILWGALCAGLAWYHVSCVEPELRARRARPFARLLAAVMAAAAIAAIGLIPVIPLPAAWVGISLAWLALALAPALLVRVTGGPRPLEGGRARLAEVLARASERVEAGDPAGWQQAMVDLGKVDDPDVRLLAAAARGYADEIAAGAPPRAETVDRFRCEYERYYGPAPTGRLAVGLAVLLAAAVGVLPGLVLGISAACTEAEELLATERALSPTAGGLASFAAIDPGPDFQLTGAGPLDLAEAASTRYDPDTLEQLQQAGFQAGSWSQWIRNSGTKLGIDVFQFRLRSGALSYQQAVTRYACRYAVEAFSVPGGGVGLRIRYGSGDPIRDQAAWIEGSSRVVIAIGYEEPPPDHAELLRLVEHMRTD